MDIDLYSAQGDQDWRLYQSELGTEITQNVILAQNGNNYKDALDYILFATYLIYNYVLKKVPANMEHNI